ncbi:hypothetical protein GCM10023318_59330 [Nocardia callitridis]|uniref:Uncharacterized protein n=1 Tax=Nocardia callitridis TaxID=648753 RepID=A0ABP9L3I1_9NOCA
MGRLDEYARCTRAAAWSQLRSAGEGDEHRPWIATMRGLLADLTHLSGGDGVPEDDDGVPEDAALSWLADELRDTHEQLAAMLELCGAGHVDECYRFQF